MQMSDLMLLLIDQSAYDQLCACIVQITAGKHGRL